VRQNPFSESASLDLVIPTGGGILDDGTIIDLIENPSKPGALALQKFDGRELEIGSQIEHEGSLYVPLFIPPSVRSALRLPSDCAPPGPTAQLFARLIAVFENTTDLAEHARKLVVAFVHASWIPELIPVPVTLFLWSPDLAAGARVLAVLSSLCRLALPLSGTDARHLTILPDELPATLLLFRPPCSRRNLESLGALGWPGFRNCRSGRLVETVGAKAMVSDTPLPDEKALGPTFLAHMVASLRPLPPLDRKALDSLANEFLPELMRFRLQRCTTVVGQESAHSYPVTPNSLVTALDVCFRNEPALAEAVSPLIESAQNGHESGRADPRAPLLEVLRARCHEPGRERLYVGEITLDLNAKIVANGGEVELTDRMVGSLLRSLGLTTRKLDRRGRGLALDGPSRVRIHRLAHEYNAPGEQFPSCVECSQLQRPPA
jgi:hypothetical protein